MSTAFAAELTSDAAPRTVLHAAIVKDPAMRAKVVILRNIVTLLIHGSQIVLEMPILFLFVILGAVYLDSRHVNRLLFGAHVYRWSIDVEFRHLTA